ncbi:SAM-dependent methyltransferase [Vibrio cholerae]|uniref:N-6 DNA methylase n=1 Tax=Vibrio cholerae TaxID=666 RepID=UPI000BA8EC9F|nr:N-6 DNA methylase [Vibrio cholerae]EGQ8408903.1 N-6 DNA methylase [Vibrio cholerae]EHD2268989.1 N-6 DNA methylase [Vibrio cholerae]EIJ2219526.1 N-6 DNA methylase [Vibrio cholerae]EJE4197741.1 N-6 DNA methylase [Vibrio cholerae]EJL6998634.1 N-6 DNA methylase [Vibrio cholerae]
MNTLITHNEAMRESLLSSDKAKLQKLVDLDGIDSVLRDLLTIEEMRDAGSFFTGQEMATKAVSCLAAITSNSVVLEPTCGAGNLLIEVSRKLGTEETLSNTLTIWGKVLWGFDINPHFVEATKLRIIIEALNRGVERDCTLEEALELLPNIIVKDALTISKTNLQNVTHVLMNPPFTIVPSPRENYWKDGKINAAGIVFDKFLRNLPEKCKISAILPDVLRSGSRYEAFRRFVSASLSGNVEVLGRFNRNTDVDVFLLSGILGKSTKSIVWHHADHESTSVSDYFDVCIGPLVAYRDPEEGSEYPYFYPKICPQWKVVREAVEKRRFTGKTLIPPFVVIKRTSSPSDRFRASATLINLKEPVVVENHMIVACPKDGKVDTCKKLIRVLQSSRTNDFLNERIRLRHLTVGAVKDIPFIETK